MALTPGTRLGPYEVVAQIGVGGMGEVYRARDTKLGRDVALKILPDAFVDDPDRLARFRREAQVLASLNHPNIAAIYGLEDSTDMRALVMELVEGEDLSQRIARGPIPIDEMLPIARQIAEALEAAHEQRIIHRDLKPANIKVRPDGTVKVLDFGLAKLTQQGEGVRGKGEAGLSQSPTITSPAMMTGVGMLLGTAAYMSPEQAKGREADKRSDIWAFGCVLYEMLTGKSAFVGDSVTEVLAGVLTLEPDLNSIPVATPRSVRELLERCLDKNQRSRLRDIGEARVQLEKPRRLAGMEGDARRWPLTRRWLLVFSGAAVGIAVFAVAWALMRPSTVLSLAPARFAIAPPPGEAFYRDDVNRPVAVSPDGSRLLYLSGTPGIRGEQQIFVRGIDDLRAAPLPGTEGAGTVFFSADGQSVGFITRDTLKRVALGGGEPMTVYRGVNGARGATWLPDDTIVFTSNGTGLLRISADGGAVTALTKPDVTRGENDHAYPSALPGGAAILFTVVPSPTSQADPQVAVLDLKTGKYKIIARGGQADYAPSGHLVYQDGTTVRAVRFDLERMEVVGQPVALPESIVSRGTAVGNFVASSNGTFVYLEGGSSERPLKSLVWISRNGQQESIDAPPRRYGVVRVSPDGTHAIVDVRDRESDLWVWDFAHHGLVRVTFDGLSSNPVWTPDGERIVFQSGRSVMARRADGTGATGVLLKMGNRPIPKAITPDGRSVIVSDFSTDSGNGLMLLTAGSSASYKPLVQTAANPALSPDGRWLAYDSNESGRSEVVVRPFPAIDGGRWQVSMDGGMEPLWSRDGRELFFIHDGVLVAAPIEASGVFRWGNPTNLFQVGSYRGNGRRYDVSLDGQRFVLMKDDVDDDPASSSLVVVVNWGEELKRLVPTK